jgi:hypothetical protein
MVSHIFIECKQNFQWAKAAQAAAPQPNAEPPTQATQQTNASSENSQNAEQNPVNYFKFCVTKLSFLG